MIQSPRAGFRPHRDDRNNSLNSVHYNPFQALALAAVLGAAGILAGCASAPEAVPEPAPAPVERRVEPAPVEPAPRAPERYVVKKGDTLWDISTMFLKDPWLWPEIWYVNPQIRNPHLIYPGDVITLFWYEGRPHLRIEREGEIYQTTLPIERLSPQVRTLPLDQAIPTIPIDAIRPFLSHPRLIDPDEYDELPYVLRTQDGRLLFGAGDSVYVRGLDGQGGRYHLVRKGDRYVDPETGDTLGFEAVEIGQGVIVRDGDPATLRVEASKREGLRGDRLLPLADDEYNRSFLPRAPEGDIRGQIIDVLDGVAQVGQYQVVTINRGAEDGLEVGHVLDVYRRGEKMRDEFSGALFRDTVQLPDERAGNLLIFRTFDRVSYGLILRATREIHLLDMVRTPET